MQSRLTVVAAADVVVVGPLENWRCPIVYLVVWSVVNLSALCTVQTRANVAEQFSDTLLETRTQHSNRMWHTFRNTHNASNH